LEKTWKTWKRREEFSEIQQMPENTEIDFQTALKNFLLLMFGSRNENKNEETF